MKKTFIHLTFFTILLFVSFLFSAFSLSGAEAANLLTCDFQVCVVDGSTQPVSGAYVKICDGDGHVYDGYTDESGCICFNGIYYPTTYDINASGGASLLGTAPYGYSGPPDGTTVVITSTGTINACP